MSNKHNGQGMFPGPTEVERLLEVTLSLGQRMEQEARELQEHMTGEVLARHEFPVCPFCGQRHPQITIALISIGSF